MKETRGPEFKKLALDEQIDLKRSDIRTDKLDMTFGEFASMYDNGELVVAPEYQRLFRWTPTQKSRFIESILLGIPTPAIFVAESEKGIWELVDGLQRLSTVLEFFGSLKDADGVTGHASKLVADDDAALPAMNGKRFEDLSLRTRLSIRRAGCRVEVVKVGSGRRMKYELFERLNTGGAHLSDQEIRNCIFRAEAPKLVEFFDDLAKYGPLQDYLGISDNQQNALYDRGLVLRFFALKNDLESFNHDVEPFITEYVHKVVDKAVAFEEEQESALFRRTIKGITDALAADSWRHLRNGKAQGAFSPYVFDALTLAVAKNIDQVEELDVEERAARFNALKADQDFKSATGSGGNTKPRLMQRLTAANKVIARA